jgi:hypothetical protein
MNFGILDLEEEGKNNDMRVATLHDRKCVFQPEFRSRREHPSCIRSGRTRPES